MKVYICAIVRGERPIAVRAVWRRRAHATAAAARRHCRGVAQPPAPRYGQQAQGHCADAARGQLEGITFAVKALISL